MIQEFSVRVQKDDERRELPLYGNPSNWPDGVYKSAKDTGAVVIVKDGRAVFLYHNGVSFTEESLGDGYILLRKGERFTLSVQSDN